MIIGITGNIGAGKSTLSQFIGMKGYRVLNADDMAKKFLKRGEVAYDTVISLFGKDILRADGEIDKKRLADIVFSDREALKKLTSVTHPLVKEKIISMSGSNKLIFIEAAVLIESGWHEIVDKIVLVFAYKGQRYMRASKKFGMKEVIRRDKLQLPYGEKLKFADFLICNTGNLLNLKLQADKLVKYIDSGRSRGI
ncbi:dephospho-CoA kinase [Desulfurobacterium indicum]|uniref:dephospho-CoA kinase n=1 Tax=Desulfurobacterium indicum TaxID=1914305 RepID=UPI000975C5E5|nr:dephospho-CoA kinase [Desulfurobacterium indicum]